MSIFPHRMHTFHWLPSRLPVEAQDNLLVMWLVLQAILFIWKQPLYHQNVVFVKIGSVRNTSWKLKTSWYPELIPKWKGQRSQKSVTKCLNPKCQTSQHDKLIQPAFAPIDQLKSTIGISTTDQLVLCQKCYNDLYQLFHPSTICRSCRATPKAGTS